MSTAAEQARALYDRHGEKLRYLVVGVANTALSYGLYLVLLWILAGPIHSLAGSSIAWLATLGNNYYLVIQWVSWVFAVPLSTTTMKYFAFRSKGRWSSQVFRAYFIYLPAQGIATVILWAAVTLAGLSPQLGQLLTIAVTTIFSYLGHKYFTFKTPLEVGEVPPRELVEKQ